MTNSVSLPKLLRPDTPSQHMPSPFPDALIGSTYIPRVPFWAYIRHSTSLLNPEPKHAPVDQNTATLKTWPTCCWSCSGSSPHARGAQRHDGQVRGRREGRGGGATCTRRTRRTRRSTRRPSRCCSGLLGTVEISRVDPRPLGVPAHDRVDEPVRTGAVREPEVV